MQQDAHKKNRQRQEWNRHHQTILDVTTRLFARLGYAGTTMQMIADECGHSVGYIYKHFSGKKALLVKIIDTQIDIYEKALDSVRRHKAGRPLEIIRCKLECTSRQILEQAHLLPLLVSQESMEIDHIRPRMMKFRRENVFLFQAAIKAKLIRPCDPEMAAAALDGMTRELIKVMTENGRIDRLHEIPTIVEDLLLGPLTRHETTELGKDEPIQ